MDISRTNDAPNRGFPTVPAQPESILRGRYRITQCISITELNMVYQAFDVQTLTPDFASHEQIHGEVRFSNDIYALGKTLDSLLPHSGHALQTIVRRATGPLEFRYRTADGVRRALSRIHRLDRLLDLIGCEGLFTSR
jgi:hypothetical protein